MTQKTVLEKYPTYSATIGMEVHVQLKTNSKIFCSCPNKFGEAPNTNLCEVCAGYPGVLPVLNKKVVDFAIMAGLATNCSITQHTTFSRKHYMYPDLPKNYQITQDKNPICQHGHIMIDQPDGSEKKVRIERMHMEEDAGKNIHASTNEGWVDLNRAGTPLLEIVSQPDMNSSAEVRAYLMQLHAIVRYLGVSDGNMDQGSFRADVNVSVKKKDAEKLGTRVEVKNVNSFRFICQAIDYEIERQIEMIENGERVRQETRQWDSKEHITIFMRSKEEAQDYRYCPEPDLPDIVIDDQWIKTIANNLPELPHAKHLRFLHDYKLTPYEAEILVDDLALANFFEDVATKSKNPKSSSNWILRDFLGYLKEHKLELHEVKVTAEHLANLIIEIDKGTINSRSAQEVFADMMSTGCMPIDIIKDKGLQQIGSTDELEAIVKQIIANNADNVAKFKAGNERIFGFFVGEAMKATKGKGNPPLLTALLKKHLE